MYTNRVLITPQKTACILSLQRAICIKSRQLKHLKMSLSNIVDNNGVVVADDLRCDLEKVVDFDITYLNSSEYFGAMYK